MYTPEVAAANKKSLEEKIQSKNVFTTTHLQTDKEQILVGNMSVVNGKTINEIIFHESGLKDGDYQLYAIQDKVSFKQTDKELVKELVDALIHCREELNAYNLELDGEEYNNPVLNALIEKAKGVLND